MKKIFSLASLFIFSCLLSQNVFAQSSKADVFNSDKELTWLGVDFTEVKFIGPATGWGEVSTKSSTEMKDNYFPAWNNLITNEPQNFKIEQAINRSSYKTYVDAVEAVNDKMPKREIFSETISDYQLLDEDKVKSMVKKYELKGKSGIGFVLIAEGMSKGKEEASYWATFIDMSSKKVLFAQRITGKAGGFGFRNYWAATMKNVFKTMKKEFKNWE
ncbi:MAG: hypothetical protein KA198_06660 [Chitinophagaceae bacterium]|nr:hypothetical protein [Chitinophagaceae bacterium]